MYELKWNPILPVNSTKKKLTKEEILAQGMVHDPRQLGGDLCDDFYEQGDMLRDFQTPEECAGAIGFWNTEQALTLKAREIVKKFEKIQPHDYFKVEPQSYNLSI